MSIFSENTIYPDEDTSLVKHFSEFHSTVFIAFLPFFKMDNEVKGNSVYTAKQISIEEAKSKVKQLEPLELKNTRVFTTNENYPDEKEIQSFGKIIKWESIIKNSELANNIELYKALKTSIGSYKRRLECIDLLKKLEDYTRLENIWHPIEGDFNLFAKKKIYETLKHFRKYHIQIVDEYYDKHQELDLSIISELEFIKKIETRDSHIFSDDKQLLFTIDWDSYFFIIAAKEEHKEFIENQFEGFFTDNRKTHLWEWKEGEIDFNLNDVDSNKKKSWFKTLIENLSSITKSNS